MAPSTHGRADAGQAGLLLCLRAHFRHCGRAPLTEAPWSTGSAPVPGVRTRRLWEDGDGEEYARQRRGRRRGRRHGERLSPTAVERRTRKRGAGLLGDRAQQLGARRVVAADASWPRVNAREPWWGLDLSHARGLHDPPQQQAVGTPELGEPGKSARGVEAGMDVCSRARVEGYSRKGQGESCETDRISRTGSGQRNAREVRTVVV